MADNKRDASADRTLWSLQYLRFAGAAMVVVLHASAGLRQAGYRPRAFFEVGNAGVDLFFVLSGFVIAWTTRGFAGSDAPRYFRSRAVRIVPLYVLATITAFVVLRGGENARGVQSLVKSLLFVPIPVPNSTRFTATYGPGWSLNYEVFFYILFGVLLTLRPTRRALAMGLVLAALVGLRLMSGTRTGIISFYTDPIIMEFAAGVALAVAVRKVIELKRSIPRTPVIAAHLAGWVVLLGPAASSRDALGDWRALAWGAPAFVIVATAVLIELVGGGVPHSGLLQRLGDASFAIYLSHLFVVRIAGEAWKRAGLSNHVPQSVLWAVSIVASMVVGVMVDRFVDQPIRSRLKPKKRR